jgi:hypothetical protein
MSTLSQCVSEREEQSRAKGSGEKEGTTFEKREGKKGREEYGRGRGGEGKGGQSPAQALIPILTLVP